MVVIGQIFFRQPQNGFSLKRLNEGLAQIEQEISLLVGKLRRCDGRGLPSTVPAQLALVLPLDQLAHAGRFHEAGQGPPMPCVGGQLKPVCSESELRIGTQVRRNLCCSGLVNPNLSRAQSRICGFKLLANLLPGERILGESSRRQHGAHTQPCTQTLEEQFHRASIVIVMTWEKNTSAADDTTAISSVKIVVCGTRPAKSGREIRTGRGFYVSCAAISNANCRTGRSPTKTARIQKSWQTTGKV